MQKQRPKPQSGGRNDMITEQDSWSGASQSPAEELMGAEPEGGLDLERVVWDPEYRRSVRHLWQEDD